MAVVDLMTSLDTYHDLHVLADTGRKTTLKVERQQLLGLLLDHSAMINELQKRGVKCRDPELPNKIKRERLD